MYRYIYIYIYVYFNLVTKCDVGTVPDTPNIHNRSTHIDRCWTTFWSPMGAIREFTTELSHRFESLCISHMVFTHIGTYSKK